MNIADTIRWFPPAILPAVRKDSKGKLTKDSDPEVGYLMLDELNSAPTIWAAVYQLFLDWNIGEYYTLPKGRRIIAAGNREGDGGVTFPCPVLCRKGIHHE